MRKRIIQLIFAFLGIGAGYSFLPGLWNLLNIQLQVLYNPIVNMFIGLILMMLCSFILAEPLEGALKKSKRHWLNKRPKRSFLRVLQLLCHL